MPLEKQADVRIVDHARKEIPPGRWVSLVALENFNSRKSANQGRSVIRIDSWKNRYAMVNSRI